MAVVGRRGFRGDDRVGAGDERARLGCSGRRQGDADQENGEERPHKEYFGRHPAI
jgi:hypothetical protein